MIFVGAIIWYANEQQRETMPPEIQPQDQTQTWIQDENLIAQAAYVCDGGKTIAAAFYEGEQIAAAPGEMPVPSGSVRIILSDGRNYDLPQAISASGARYANDDESFVFWDKGGNAMVLENGEQKDFTGCAVAPADGEGQNIKVISPNGGEEWSKGQKVEILWQASEITKSVNIRLMVADDGEGQSFNAAIATGVDNTGTYEWTVRELYAEVLGINDLPASDKYTLVVEDAQNNSIYDAGDAPFAIE